MKVRVHAADDGGCGWYRMRFPARAAAAAGADVALRGEVPGWLLTHEGSAADTWKVDDDYDADVAVFQRPLHRNRLEIIHALQQRGTAVVIDMDDDFGALPKGHPARRDTATMANPDANRRWMRRACEMADLVTLSTPALAERYAPHGRFVVLPNCVPRGYLDVRPRPHEGLWAGWTGSVVTHVGDLDVTGGGVAAAVEAAGARFHVVGTGHGVAQGLGLAVEPSTTGWTSFQAYPRRYAELDVAIVPLADNRFNAAKSWLKGMEAASLGVPFVASPTAEYRRLVDGEGCGVLAASPDEWRGAVRLLAGDVRLRDEMAEKGREVAARWTYEARWWRWVEAWEQALEQRRGRVAA